MLTSVDVKTVTSPYSVDNVSSFFECLKLKFCPYLTPLSPNTAAKRQQAFTHSSLTVSELNRKPVNLSVRLWPEMFQAVAGCKLKVYVMQ